MKQDFLFGFESGGDGLVARLVIVGVSIEDGVAGKKGDDKMGRAGGEVFGEESKVEFGRN